MYKATYEKGFTLIELTLVMVIIGFLSVGGINLAKVKREQALYSSAETKLNQIKEALVTYVLVNGHLPCPDTNSNGEESRAFGGNHCLSSQGHVFGRVPYLDLGVSEASVKDNWGNFIVYAANSRADSPSRVSDEKESASFFDRASSLENLTFNLKTPPTADGNGLGNLTICDVTVPCDGGIGESYWARHQLVVLVAHNSNGIKTKADCSAMKSGEKENCDGDDFFVHKQILLKKGSNFFDDILVTISAMDIKTAILKHNLSSID